MSPAGKNGVGESIQADPEPSLSAWITNIGANQRHQNSRVPDTSSFTRSPISSLESHPQQRRHQDEDDENESRAVQKSRDEHRDGDQYGWDNQNPY